MNKDIKILEDGKYYGINVNDICVAEFVDNDNYFGKGFNSETNEQIAARIIRTNLVDIYWARELDYCIYPGRYLECDFQDGPIIRLKYSEQDGCFYDENKTLKIDYLIDKNSKEGKKLQNHNNNHMAKSMDNYDLTLLNPDREELELQFNHFYRAPFSVFGAVISDCAELKAKTNNDEVLPYLRKEQEITRSDLKSHYLRIKHIDHIIANYFNDLNDEEYTCKKSR